MRVSALRPVLSKGQADTTARMLAAVSNPTRLQILSLIQNSESGLSRTADLTVALQLSQPSVTHHMKVMTEAGILNREPAGREVWYSIANEWINVIADLLR